MRKLYKTRHRFPWSVIKSAINMHNKKSMSYREIKSILALKKIHVSHKTIHEWVHKFAQEIADENVDNLIYRERK